MNSKPRYDTYAPYRQEHVLLLDEIMRLWELMKNEDPESEIYKELALKRLILMRNLESLNKEIEEYFGIYKG